MMVLQRFTETEEFRKALHPEDTGLVSHAYDSESRPNSEDEK